MRTMLRQFYIERGESKPTKFPNVDASHLRHKLPRKPTKREITTAINSQNGNIATWHDYIPSELIKSNNERFANILRHYLKNGKMGK